MKSENKNFVLNVAYQGMTLVFPLVTVPYISRVLGVDNIGIYSYTYNIAYIFMLAGMLGINNYGKFRHPGLDLAQFDTQAANLDLVVIAPQVFERSVRRPTAQISGPVHPSPRLIAVWIPDKALAGQLRLVQVTSGDPYAADVDLAGHADGGWIPPRIQYVDARIGNGLPNRKMR